MKIVLDVNIILSALIKDSTTRKIILESKLDFYFPESSLNKIRKYEGLVLQKSGITKEIFLEVLITLFKNIQLVSSETILRNWSKAIKIMAHIDEEDVIFVAAALGLEDSLIWSDDKDFEKQDIVKVLKTKDVVAIFEAPD